MANPAQPWEDGGEGNPMRGREEEGSLCSSREEHQIESRRGGEGVSSSLLSTAGEILKA